MLLPFQPFAKCAGEEGDKDYDEAESRAIEEGDGHCGGTSDGGETLSRCHRHHHLFGKFNQR